MSAVAITGVGICCALGTDAAGVLSRLGAGDSGLSALSGVEEVLPLCGLARVVGPVLELRRRRDRKLFARATQLALAAALDDEPGEVGLFLGVGREPPEDDAVEEALVRSARAGRLDAQALGEEGVRRYPPLASLRTLPNLALAHVAIQRGFTGVGATCAGEEAAGLAAVVQGLHAVQEGRSRCCWVGGTDSRVAPALARDLVRRGLAGPTRSPGEAAAWLRLEPLAHAERPVLAVLEEGGTGWGIEQSWSAPFEHALGSCGAASAPLALALAVAAGEGGMLEVSEASGATAWCRWRFAGA